MKVKLPVVFVICGVILVHVLFFSCLKHHGTSSRMAQTPTQEAAETGENRLENPESSNALPLPAVENLPKPEKNSEAALPPSAVFRAWPNFSPYHEGYFQPASATEMPASLKNLLKDCGAGIAVDLDSRKLYWEKAGSSPQYIASLTKMVTVYGAMKKLYGSQGAIDLDTRIPVTVSASKIGGRQVWLDPKETFTFDELLKCTLVHSANDAAYLLAEFCSGTESAFVAEMQREMQTLGCRNFHLLNSNGLPEKALRDENRASPRELAYLAGCLLQFPEVLKWSGVRRAVLREKDEAFLKKNGNKPLELVSSNHLLGTCNGVNGMKTGYTARARSCIVVTCRRNGRNICLVLTGCSKMKIRDQIAVQMLDWVYLQK